MSEAIKAKLDECFLGKVITYEFTHTYPELGERELLITYLPVEGPAGIDRAACVLRDVTNERRAEKALRESEQLFHTIYERAPVGITLVDSRTGRFLRVNSKFCEITGRSETELLQSDISNVSHPDDIDVSQNYLTQLAEEKLTSYEIDKRYLRPDRSVRWVRVLAVPMWAKGETRRWHMALAKDITGRKHTESAIATLVQQVQSDSSENFFNSMAIQLARCLEADYTIIGEVIPGEKDKVRTIGVCGHGVIEGNIIYDLAGTPSEAVLRQGTCSFPAGVADLFPRRCSAKTDEHRGICWDFFT